MHELNLKSDDKLTQLLHTFEKIEGRMENDAKENGNVIAEMREVLDGVRSRIEKLEDGGPTGKEKGKKYQIIPNVGDAANLSEKQRLCLWMAEEYALKHGMGGDQYERALEYETRADQEIGTTDPGGVLVPIPLVPTLINIVQNYGVARQLCRRWPMSQLTIEIPRSKNDNVTINWEGTGGVGEGTPPSAGTGITFAKLQLAAKKLVAYSEITSEADREAILPIMDFVLDSFGRQMAKKEDDAFLNGASPPRVGVFPTCALTQWEDRTSQDQLVQAAAGVVSFATFAANANGLSYDALVETQHAVDPTLIDQGTWIFHPDVLGILRKFKDASNNPIWNAGVSGVAPATILGRPYVTTTVAPSTDGVSENVLCYGDFGNYYAMGVRDEYSVAFSLSLIHI